MYFSLLLLVLGYYAGWNPPLQMAIGRYYALAFSYKNETIINWGYITDNCQKPLYWYVVMLNNTYSIMKT